MHDKMHPTRIRCINMAMRRRGRGRVAVRPMAIFERFSENSIKVCMLAQQEAMFFESSVQPEHIFLGLVGADCMRFPFDVKDARHAVASVTGMPYRVGARFGSDDVPFSDTTRQAFKDAMRIAENMLYVMPEHLFLSIVDFMVVGNAIMALDQNPVRLAEDASVRIDLEAVQETRVAKKAKAGKTEALDAYCVDMVSRAEDNKIDPVVGRDREVDRVVQILTRRRKNNPILLGDAGVGKTAVVEGLARLLHMSNATLPDALKECRIYALDLNAMMAGTKERGEFEARLKALLEDVRKNDDVILFIDEIHGIVRAGVSENDGLDAANILKPALARGELRCIGATTWSEYKKIFERDGALDRRFQRVFVHEPTEQETLEILQGLRDRYELFHGCRYEDEALEHIVKACRVLGDRKFPDKAIDVMDETGSTVRLRCPPGTLEERRKLIQARAEAVSMGRFADAARLHLEIVHSSIIPSVRTEDVELAVETWSGVSWSDLQFDGAKVFAEIGTRVVGQEDARDRVVRALTRAFGGLRDNRRPVASMIFVGPTGVGKTEMAKAIATAAFAGRLVRIDMSEYMEPHTVSRLIGAPPGYVGYDEPGILTEAVRRRPQGVILLDEIEKAHPRILNVLLQILEDGRLTDAKGRVASFREAMIIMTSNLGSSAAEGEGTSSTLGGFRALERSREAGSFDDSSYQEAVRKHFRPEIVNRIDEIIAFRPLDKDALSRVVETVIRSMLARVPAEIQVSIDPAVKDRIAELARRGRGARDVRRLVASLIEDRIADAILAGDRHIKINV
jgi:ATP-dependent Clp protease ATP-binding subunit ClpC